MLRDLRVRKWGSGTRPEHAGAANRYRVRARVAAVHAEQACSSRLLRVAAAELSMGGPANWTEPFGDSIALAILSNR